MEINFFGSAKMVTGSNFLIETKSTKILIDCGMFQGSKEVEKMNFIDFPYNPEEIDYLLLTHAHIDHSGRIPKLVKDGFNGRIICTKATNDLCEIMLMDSAHIQESDVKWENKKRMRAGLSEIKPLYTSEDAELSLKYFEPYYYDQFIELNDEISIRFKDAGHILGSAILELWIKEDDKTTKFVFSGDLGMPGRPIIRDPEFIDEADYLIVESTYGDSTHEPYEENTRELIDIINKTAIRGGTVLIPSFAVGRTQELIYELNRYYEYGKVEEHMKIPIYVDSPLGINATEVFMKNSINFNEETRQMILEGDNPFLFENLRYVQSQEESVTLNKVTYPKVIISSSGMATAGRIRHHLKHNLWNPMNSLVFVGYQAEGTLGRILLDGIKKVKLLGEEINVGLEIYDLEGFSAHADQEMLMRWISKFRKKPKKIFIVHGEEEASTTLAESIENEFNIETIIPNLGDKINIENNYLKVEVGNDIEPIKMREEIGEELDKVYNKFEALFTRPDEILYDDEVLKKNHNKIRNKLIEIQDQLMDINILLGK